jgi:hypothetical protein
MILLNLPFDDAAGGGCASLSSADNDSSTVDRFSC